MKGLYYEQYQFFMENFTYEAFINMVKNYCIYWVWIIVLIINVLAAFIIMLKCRPNAIARKKIKLISKWERRSTNEQTKLMIDQYIEHYTKVNKIDWNEYL